MPTIDEDLALLGETLGDELHSEHEAFDALTRIRAALADREHLEEGAQLLLYELGHARQPQYSRQLYRWIAAERSRQSGKGGA